MDPTLLTALLTFLTALVPILGGIVTIKINNSRLDEKDKALGNAVNDSVTNAVKAIAQTMLTGKRDASGRLPPEVAEIAKASALELSKVLLGSEKLQQAQIKYGMSGADKVLATLLEAALHDVKATKSTTMQSTSVASPRPDGSVITATTQTATASATETPPANP